MPEKLSNTIPEKYGARSKSERAKLNVLLHYKARIMSESDYARLA